MVSVFSERAVELSERADDDIPETHRQQVLRRRETTPEGHSWVESPVLVERFFTVRPDPKRDGVIAIVLSGVSRECGNLLPVKLAVRIDAFPQLLAIRHIDAWVQACRIHVD